MALQSKNRKGPVVLVSRRIQYSFPLSYAYLAGYLKAQGEEVVMLFKEHPIERLCEMIAELKPLLVGFGSLYPELKEIKEIVARLDSGGRDFPVVVGGQMVSPTPEFAVKITGADYGVVGEGELTLFSLTRARREGRDPATGLGRAIRQGDDVELTGPGEYIEDLSTLPEIPYELFPSEKWLGIGKWYSQYVPNSLWGYGDRVVNIHGGRGCPYSCNFCYHHSKPRYRPVESMVADAAEMLDRFDANVLYFSDDTTLISPQRAEALVKGLKGLRPPHMFAISSRFDIIARMDDSLLQELKDAGCIMMGLGFESGSNRILLDVIGKKMTAEIMLDGMRRLRNAGIAVTGNFMVGQHTETLEDVDATSVFMRRCLEIMPHAEFSFSLTTPFPGSKLYKMILDEGMVKDDRDFYGKFFADGKGETWNPVVNLTAMSDADVIASYQRLQREYRERKIKAFGRLLPAVYFSQLAAGKLWRIGDKALSFLPGQKSDSGSLRAALSALHGVAQRDVLSKINWRIRGLDKLRGGR